VKKWLIKKIVDKKLGGGKNKWLRRQNVG